MRLLNLNGRVCYAPRFLRSMHWSRADNPDLWTRWGHVVKIEHRLVHVAWHLGNFVERIEAKCLLRLPEPEPSLCEEC